MLDMLLWFSDELKMKVAIFGREEGCLLYFMLINYKNVV